MTKKEFQGEWSAPVSFPAAPSEVAHWSQGVQGPLCRFSSSRLRTGALRLPLRTGPQAPTTHTAEWVGKNAEWSQAAFPQMLKQKMKIRLTEKKQFLFKKKLK